MISQNVTRPLATATPGGCPPVGIQLEGLILPPLLMVDVILGLLGNVVALWIFTFKLKSWNPNNLFLFNLVIADFLALVSLPLRIDALLRRHWLFGDAMCRINLFLMFSNRSASIALMTVVAFYRYFKVRKELSVHFLSFTTQMAFHTNIMVPFWTWAFLYELDFLLGSVWVGGLSEKHDAYCGRSKIQPH